MKKIILILSCLFLFFISAAEVDAAALYFLPEAGSLGLSQEFSVDIKVNSEEVSINAIQAIIHFPADILELLSVDKQGSAFNFWVEEPFFSNEEGTLSFIGGTAKGVSGESLQVLKMKFKARGIGSAELAISDAVVTASDGRGTNVLSMIEGINIGIGTEVIKPEPVPAPETKEPVEKPEKVEREPILAKDLPEEPKLRVPLYPDEAQWYNHLGEVIVLWETPSDVVEVETKLSQTRDKKGGDIEPELFTGKTFGFLTEGIWYVRVQFKNNVGWGPFAYYKIAVDTTAPLPFEIEIDSEVSDNPSPEIRYKTQDSLSGISHALIFIDGQKPIEFNEEIIKLPIQPPGKHTVLVRIFDLAGNSVEDNLEFEVLPLPAPTISFITRAVSQEELIFASGKAIANGFVDVKVFNKEGQVVFAGVADTNEAGNWEIIIEDPLAKGKYTLTAAARDDRGAISYPTEAEAVKIKAKTILSIGFIDLGWFEILLIIFLLVISSTSAGAWYYIAVKRKREAYRIVAVRDIDKLTTLLAEDLRGLEGWVEKSKEGLKRRAKPEMEFYLKNLHSTVDKMKKYLRQELDKL